ncbi:MAG: proton-conducting transporter transmembrane domain-containing protein [Vulcanimicrobiaceae bacterium]
MTTWIIVAPLLAAALTTAFPDVQARRYARIVLSTAAALLPIVLIGKIDDLSLIFTAIVSVLGLLATLFSVGTFSIEWGIGHAVWSRKSVYFLLVGAFWSAMLLVVLASNFAALWLGISATTLATAFLVGFSGEAAALEAAWKYLVLCSLGIGFALLGIVVLAHVSIAMGLDPAHALSWVSIAGHPPSKAPPLARLATALMLIGFATKAGLVPMHAWLPDAHSKAPAPVSALLSGVLVSCALYAMMRTLAVGSTLGAAPLLHNLLMWFGAISAVLAGMAMLTQRDLKRLLAYSTVEHAGIVALALGFGGPLGLLAALIHAIAHAFSKSAAFFAAGMVQREHHTTELGKLRALWKTGRSGRFLLATFTALAGMPPFGLFVSELLLVLAGIAAHRLAPLMVGLVGIALAFAALSRTAIEIQSGQAKLSGNRIAPPRSRLAFLTTSLALAAALGIAVVPWTPLAAVLQATASAIGGVR